MNATDIPLEERIIFALDVADPREALALVDQLSGSIRFFKVGLQLFFAGGWPVVEHIVRKGCKVMLDLKLYDIPATVQLAVRQFADRGITFTTVHGYGPVVEAALAADTGIQILAVTVLTSFDQSDLADLGYPCDVGDLVRLRVQKAMEAGIDGIVCSPLEAESVRRLAGPKAVLVTPGVRSAGTAAGDQKRVATPADAIRAGANYLVMGRQITRAADPAAEMRRVLTEIAG